jgi:hypothetical protein
MGYFRKKKKRTRKKPISSVTPPRHDCMFSYTFVDAFTPRRQSEVILAHALLEKGTEALP